MSDEDDFMSDAWLEKAKEFDRKSNADRSKKKRKEPTPQPKPVAVLEKQQREQGLAKPISENNIGFKLLAAMGYKSGQSIGQTTGLVEPLALDIRGAKDKSGLGVLEEEKKAKEMSEKAQAKIAEFNNAKRVKLQEEFQASQKTEFANKKTGGQLKKAVIITRELDDQAGVQENELLVEYKAAEEREENPVPLGVYIHQELTQEQREVKLLQLLNYLRTKHLYCCYCTSKFADCDEMAKVCPGILEEDHE